jgi:hypothetical protein
VVLGSLPSLSLSSRFRLFLVPALFPWFHILHVIVLEVLARIYAGNILLTIDFNLLEEVGELLRIDVVVGEF